MHTLLGHTLQEKGPERKGTWVHLGLDEETKIGETKASPCVCPKKTSQLDTLMQAPHSSGFSHDSYFETLKSFILVPPPKPKKKKPLTTQLWCPGGNLPVSGSSLGTAQKAGASAG